MTTPSSTDRPPRGVAGRLVLLTLFVMLLGVPLVIAAMVRWMPAEIRHEQLDWAGRADWHALRVRPATLNESGLAALLGGAEFRKIPFNPTEPEQAALAACHALARELEAAAASALPPAHVREQLEALTAEHPTLFYPAYLLATWHRMADNADEAEHWTAEAFARAPAALLIPYVDEAGQPLADLKVGAIELGFDRVIDDQVDQSVQLIYPALVTDEGGQVYLPVYHTVYRAVRLPAPAGPPAYEATYDVHRWFEMPAQVGILPPVVVKKSSS